MNIQEVIEVLTKKFSNPELAEAGEAFGMYEKDRRIIYALKHVQNELNSLAFENAKMKNYIIKRVVFEEGRE